MAAIVLSQSRTSTSDQKISRLLGFFGVTGRPATVEEFLNELAANPKEPLHVLGVAENFLTLVQALESQPEKQQLWKKHIRSAFCSLGQDGSLFQELTGRWHGELKVRLQSAEESAQPWKISDREKDFCGSLSGLVVVPIGNGSVWLCESSDSNNYIIAKTAGAAFLRAECHGVPFFLSTHSVIDIEAPLPGRLFDIRSHLPHAAPAVLYIKWAFADVCWQPPEARACVVIDDPLLRPRYGFLDYERLLDLMAKKNFSTSIAFIPWNWNRSAPRTTKLLRDHSDRFSLSIHGSDHIKAEYGSQDRDWLVRKSRQSIERMERHRAVTHLEHDRVMVFPQGVFSETAMSVLKSSEFIGSVNSEVISTDPAPRTIKIADYWNVAVMNYSDYPIFTRRYPWAGVENFAFDFLLGKPCLINIHHNDCHDDYQCLTRCIEQLNGLNVHLLWGSLADAVRHGYRQREISPGVMEVEIFGHELELKNSSRGKKRFKIHKQESEPEKITDIRLDNEPAKWSAAGKRVEFEASLEPGESRMIKIVFKGISADGILDGGWLYQAKVGLRRYLCEFRDNYVMRKSFSE